MFIRLVCPGHLSVDLFPSRPARSRRPSPLLLQVLILERADLLEVMDMFPIMWRSVQHNTGRQRERGVKVRGKGRRRVGGEESHVVHVGT